MESRMTEQHCVAPHVSSTMKARRHMGARAIPSAAMRNPRLPSTAEGSRRVALMGAHRPRFYLANDFTEGTPEETLEAGKQYLTYAGTYEVPEPLSRLKTGGSGGDHRGLCRALARRCRLARVSRLLALAGRP